MGILARQSWGRPATRAGAENSHFVTSAMASLLRILPTYDGQECPSCPAGLQRWGLLGSMMVGLAFAARLWANGPAVGSHLGGPPGVIEARGSERAPSALGPAEAEAVRGAVRQSFEGPEFWWKRTARVEGPELPGVARAIGKLLGWIADGLEALLKWLADLLEGLFGTRWTAGRLPGWFLWGVLTGLTVLVIGALLWRRRQLLARWLRGETREPPARRLTPQERLPGAGQLFERARQMAREGRFRDAVRYAFLALLASLQDRGLLRYDPSRTNREYYHELLPRGALADRFLSVAVEFDRTWYGRLPVDRGQAEQMIARCERLVYPQPEGRET